METIIIATLAGATAGIAVTLGLAWPSRREQRRLAAEVAIMRQQQHFVSNADLSSWSKMMKRPTRRTSARPEVWL